jgi:hypothetical protein
MPNSKKKENDAAENANDHEPVDPANRGEESDAAISPEITDEHSRSSSHNTQNEQNHDMNKNYDPSQGKRHDQLRRNDKRGQMGG